MIKDISEIFMGVSLNLQITLRKVDIFTTSCFPIQDHSRNEASFIYLFLFLSKGVWLSSYQSFTFLVKVSY